MSSAILCILLCLGPLTVMGQKPIRTRPSQPSQPRQSLRVPWPGQQCKDTPVRYAGICSGYPDVCEYLVCAFPDGEGRFIPTLHIAASENTVCGPSKICRHQKCIDVDATNLPIQTGERAEIECLKPGEPIVGGRTRNVKG